MYFVDARKFGRLCLWPCQSQSCPGLGPEPLNPASVLSVLSGLNTCRPIKTVLLDQTILAGVENIYADEALYVAGISPPNPCRQAQRRAAATLEPLCATGAKERHPPP